MDALRATTPLDAVIDGLSRCAGDLGRSYDALVHGNTRLTARALWGTVLVSALATEKVDLAEAARREAATHLDARAMKAAQSAVDKMGVNRAAGPARSRDVDELDFELWLLAVSTVHGCVKCIETHERAARERGASREMALTVVRIASLLGVIGATLAADHAVVSA